MREHGWRRRGQRRHGTEDRSGGRHSRRCVGRYDGSEGVRLGRQRRRRNRRRCVGRGRRDPREARTAENWGRVGGSDRGRHQRRRRARTAQGRERWDARSAKRRRQGRRAQGGCRSRGPDGRQTHRRADARRPRVQRRRCTADHGRRSSTLQIAAAAQAEPDLWGVLLAATRTAHVHAATHSPSFTRRTRGSVRALVAPSVPRRQRTFPRRPRRCPDDSPIALARSRRGGGTSGPSDVQLAPWPSCPPLRARGHRVRRVSRARPPGVPAGAVRHGPRCRGTRRCSDDLGRRGP